jgi:hypothetical protein
VEEVKEKLKQRKKALEVSGGTSGGSICSGEARVCINEHTSERELEECLREASEDSSC